MESLAEIMARVERLTFAGEAEQQTTPDVALSASPSSDEHSLLPLAVPQAEMLLPPEYGVFCPKRRKGIFQRP